MGTTGTLSTAVGIFTSGGGSLDTTVDSSGAAVAVPAGFNPTCAAAAGGCPSQLALSLSHTADPTLLLSIVTASSATMLNTSPSTGRRLLVVAPEVGP